MKKEHDTGFLSSLRFEPLTLQNWGKFEELFGAKGACGNCWCMSFRLSKSDFEEGKSNKGNKEAKYALVKAGKPTGLLAFYEDIPVAWCAFSPREDFVKLSRSRVHKPIDSKPGQFPALLLQKISAGWAFQSPYCRV
ncbi:MAG: family acetyltransferase [Crocinitomicaceae bacterium]|jgi:hypothetical protein|nr:family acetyltransferase [Crocinitomicaceae bacterium]